jgi:hypothetical protein
VYTYGKTPLPEDEGPKHSDRAGVQAASEGQSHEISGERPQVWSDHWRFSKGVLADHRHPSCEKSRQGNLAWFEITIRSVPSSSRTFNL